MDKDKQVIVPQGLQSLNKISVQLGLANKIMSEAELLTVPTMEWWDNLSTEWKRHFLFHILYSDKIHSQSSFIQNYDKWYLQNYGKQFKPKMKISQSTMKQILYLTDVSLPNSSITDLNPLRSLKSLKYLELRFNEIEDLSPLANLGELEYLTLIANNIENIEPLSKLTKLRELRINLNGVCDIGALKNLHNLRKLDIGECGNIQNLSPLQDLTGLEELNIGMNNAKNIEPIGNLTALKILSLWAMSISSFEPLIKLPNLESLCLQDTGIGDQDLLNLSKIKKLKHLDLMINPVTNKAVDLFSKIRPDVVINFDRNGNSYYFEEE